MEIIFTDKKLEQLYTKGSCTKYKLDQSIIKSFITVIAYLESAKDIYDLWKLPSLNFERMQGSENKFSIRLNRKWRLEMKIEWANNENISGVISLEKISSHYGG